ncbi:PREDICTED: uncharacterized protein LOC100633019 [Amphimedon queenslandica]|uniref:ATP-dependent DNA helicase n=1 Tax=Amphimedon queenslandica TaxID=400682 RepID=A0AAN0JN57_AMPQE|nr:PREDICTED: uncharacterized protein LOC100633019 [Amphimedon queenslandica]|eukprot:XP_019858455.1 PREDICTED: uncharacterized protein LOC100633019 [Amphimedon queenslandica]
MDSALDSAIDAAGRRLGYETVKEDQRYVIRSFLEGKDVFACLPTGYGKSLCYFILPLVYDILQGHSSPWFVEIVISPLQALMKDQVKSLQDKGMTAVSVMGREDEETKQGIVSGRYQVVFTTPELLLQNKDWIHVFQSASLTERLIAIVIDEAHCVKKWGSNFRKEFSKLGDLRGFFPSHLHFMALTATASQTTRKSVIKLLGMHKPVTISKSPSKCNIIYFVTEKADEIEVELAYLVDELRAYRTNTTKTIVFCRTYNDCSRLYMFFKSQLKDEMREPIGHPDVTQFRLVDMFIATNTASVKNAILKSFSTSGGRLRILIATIAFGMGIDCPDIHRVIHWGPPSDCESYIQETGRTGRDGLPSNATLYYSRRDIGVMHLDKSIIDYCQNRTVCRRQVLFKDFNYDPATKPIDCKCCDLCIMICQCENCDFTLNE